MNRFQHDNIDPNLTAKRRESALKAMGINWLMKKDRRKAKHDRHRANADARRAASAPASSRR